MYGIDRKRYFWVVVSALIQGLLLGKYSQTRSGLFLALPLTLVIIVPFALWLTQEHWGRRLWRFITALTLLLALCYAYWLWSVFPPGGEFYYLPTQNMNLARICAVVFLFLPFFQCRIATWSWHVPYSEVFFQLCRNVFLLFQAAIVTVVFWALLLTASLLFEIIGLGIVPLLIFSPLVSFPLTSLTIALSITLALKHPGIDSLGRWILSILAWLLPPFSILSVVFVISLPFSGLKTLWDTGQASSLMLLLQFATVLLANAAWLDGTRTPFSNRLIDFIARLSLLCLPIYTTLCLYSLGLRVQQYGWSVDRMHAAFFVVIMAIWGMSYAATVLMRQWPNSLGRVNIAATLLMALLVLAMNSPLLDPYRLSANNQADRLLSGAVDAYDFDFLYLRFNLGRYGNYALNRLKRTEKLPRRNVIEEHIAAALEVDPKEHWESHYNGIISEHSRRDIMKKANVYPAGRHIPRWLADKLSKLWNTPEFSPMWSVRRVADVAFSFKDVAGDNAEELVMVKNGLALVFNLESEDPKIIGALYGDVSPALLTSEDFQVAPPRFRDLRLNGEQWQILPIQPAAKD